MCREVGDLPGGGVKDLSAGALIEVEAGGAGCDVKLLSLECRDV